MTACLTEPRSSKDARVHLVAIPGHPFGHPCPVPPGPDRRDTAPMLMRSPTDPTTDLDATRRRVDRAAGAAALAADRHFLRLCGMALVRAAEVNGADYEVERLNDRLRARGSLRHRADRDGPVAQPDQWPCRGLASLRADDGGGPCSSLISAPCASLRVAGSQPFFGPGTCPAWSRLWSTTPPRGSGPEPPPGADPARCGMWVIWVLPGPSAPERVLGSPRYL